VRRLPLKPFAVYNLLKEIRTAVEDFRPLLIAGAVEPAAKIASALVQGGDEQGVRNLAGREPTAYDVQGAEVLVYVIEGDAATPEDERMLRLADRHDVEIVCVIFTAAAEPPDVPHVLATDIVVVRPGQEIPFAQIVERVADRAGDTSYVLAAKLPAIRHSVCQQIVTRFARQNGILGAAIFIPGADFPVLTLNQIRMVLRLAAAHGEEIDAKRAVELLGVVGAGLGFRALARQALAAFPGPGWAIKGSVGYAGTLALGEAALKYFESGGQKVVNEALDSVRSRS
jgi:uncharacterized protein (DUF697 family)